MNNFISQKFRFFSFLSMLLLVFVHGYNLQNGYLQPFTIVEEPLSGTTFIEYFISNGILRFRIPMLFIISGYLFALHDQKPYANRMKKRLRTLGIPYLFWSAFALLLTFTWQQFPAMAEAVRQAQIDQMGDNRPYTEIGFLGLMMRWVLAPTAFQLWFIRSLLLYNALYPLLLKAIMRIPKIWFPITGFLWLTTFGLFFIEGEGLFFFTLGIAIQKSGFNIEKHAGWLNLKIWAPVFILTAVVKSLLAFNMDGSITSFIILSLLHKACVFSGLVTMWFGFDRVVRYFMNKIWFTWLSAFAFIIYAMHVPLVNYCTRLSFTHFQGLPNYRLITYFILPILITVSCILFGALFRKILPKTYSLATGGRGLA